MAHNGDLGLRTAMLEEDADASAVSFFLYAKLSPRLHVIFLELRQEATFWPDRDDASQLAELALASRRTFRFLEPLRVVSAPRVPLGDDASILVLEDLRFDGERVVACHDPRPFDEFIRHHPRPRRQTPSRRATPPATSSNVLDEMLA